MARIRKQIVVRGIVQGVGFRPFVYRIATDLGLAGYITNRSDAVRVEVEGSLESVAAFEHKLKTDAPPLAVILGIDAMEIPRAHRSPRISRLAWTACARCLIRTIGAIYIPS
jgi:hydrogenase maturation protein HypF